MAKEEIAEVESEESVVPEEAVLIEGGEKLLERLGELERKVNNFERVLERLCPQVFEELERLDEKNGTN